MTMVINHLLNGILLQACLELSLLHADKQPKKTPQKSQSILPWIRALQDAIARNSTYINLVRFVWVEQIS